MFPEHSLKVFSNRVLGKIFGCNREMEKLRNEDFYNLFYYRDHPVGTRGSFPGGKAAGA
jgi:hypothetical protein